MTPYDKHPFIAVDDDGEKCASGWQAIGARLRAAVPARRAVIAVECYPGVLLEELELALAVELRPAAVIRADEALLPPAEIEIRLRPLLTEDPVFGFMNELSIRDFFDAEKLRELLSRTRSRSEGLTLVLGCGASLIVPDPDLLVYADMARWEIQQRQRRNQIGNLGLNNSRDSAAEKYKRAFFVDWRAADRLKRELLDRIEFLLDTNTPAIPKMIAGKDFRRALQQAATRPFRLVPFFDPGPWGGHWMARNFDLPPDKPNYAWCFDCVPEENSLLLGFGEHRLEIPAIDLLLSFPHELLGESVYARFGAEFPIRFDILDTMGGGNLSLQVHPLTEFIRRTFGMAYTQDESYYILDGAADAVVYLGLREGIYPSRMAADLRAAQEGIAPFSAEAYVNRFPARKHDHFSIPAGTVHCSGRNCVVLEISATPYIFTFKLWDWGRLGLDGKPRPIHLDYGLANIQWNRTTAWVQDELIDRIETLGSGPCWREERTGLHRLEFIETRRHWFTGMVPHDTCGGVNVLNLVEGAEAIVESPDRAFEPFPVNYAETFIVPAAVGPYTIRPATHGAGEMATLKAFVREDDAN